MGIGDNIFNLPMGEGERQRGKERKYSFPYCETVMGDGSDDVPINFEDISKDIKLEPEDNSDSESPPIFPIPDSPDMDDLPYIKVEDDDGLVMVHMDIREPLTHLKSQLESRLKVELDDWGFTLQESQVLEGHMNLVDQCVQGEGLVQVNVKLNHLLRSINIVDVLKPAEEYVEIANANNEDEEENPDSPVLDKGIRWVVDSGYKRALKKTKTPSDPWEWNREHVRTWVKWAIKQFNLTEVNLDDWIMDGTELCTLDMATFKEKAPRDPDSLFWTHFELLRKCRIVAVCVNTKEGSAKNELDDGTVKYGRTKQSDKIYRMAKLPRMVTVDPRDDSLSSEWTPAKRACLATSSGGQVQLWQFLLDILTDKNYRNIIQWLEDDGEFKLINPEFVAQLWGERKKKPMMNYEKLSRALRYYYGTMIEKVAGQRFVYKFICDLKFVVGYSAKELNALVVEAELNAKTRKRKKSSIFLHSSFPELPEHC